MGTRHSNSNHSVSSPRKPSMPTLTRTVRFRRLRVLRYSFAGARKGAYPGPQGPVAQLVSAPPCHGGGRGFESRRGRVTDDGSHHRDKAR